MMHRTKVESIKRKNQGISKEEIFINLFHGAVVKIYVCVYVHTYILYTIKVSLYVFT